jgi:hypothetical protein
MRMWRLLLGLWVCAVCACGSSTGKPLHVFPSREKLAEMAAGTGAKQSIAVEEVALEQWQLELAPLPSPNSGHTVLATVTPKAQPVAELDCVAQEYARIIAQTEEKPPTVSLRRFIAARCGTLIAVPRMHTWFTRSESKASYDTVMAHLASRLDGPIDTQARQAGIGLARGEGKIVIVAAFGDPDVELETSGRVVSPDGVLEIRGKVLLDALSLQAYVNSGEWGVQRCELDPGVAPPRFTLRCKLAKGDDAAWLQLFATPRGHVLAQEVLSVLALRSEQSATQYSRRQLAAAQPVSDAAGFQSAVLELVNGIRGQTGLAKLALARKQSQVASSATPALFRALLTDSEDGRLAADGISLGLMAGWDVTGGLIRDAALASSMTLESLDAERWLSEALERPSARAVLLAPDARVLALGASVQAEPAMLAGLALTYAFFQPEANPGERAMRVLERLGRVRKARGLGRTVVVRGAPGVQEQLARITRLEASPSDGLRAAMEYSVAEFRRSVQGFVWETHDLDAIEFPPELLQKGDLTLSAGVTYYRAPGGAWGQYAVLFVVFQPYSTKV